VVERLEKVVLSLGGLVEKGSASQMQSGSALSDQYRRELAAPPAVERGIATPFRWLRRLMPGRLYVLAGETAHGKTVLGGQYARAACQEGAAVGFFSIEMTRAQLFDRMLACYGIPLPQVESRRVAPFYADTLERALKETARWRVEINDERSANHVTFRRWQRLRHYDLIVIDHLHEIDIEGRASDRRVNLEQELLRIASVARDLNVPILLLAQLSRGEGRPNLAKLRESGRIEQVAAQVQFIWRKPTESGEPGTEAELIVAKDRFGPTGKMPLHFDGEMVRFTEVEERAA
jgi:replicative DNA helicase